MRADRSAQPSSPPREYRELWSGGRRRCPAGRASWLFCGHPATWPGFLSASYSQSSQRNGT